MGLFLDLLGIIAIGFAVWRAALRDWITAVILLLVGVFLLFFI